MSQAEPPAKRSDVAGTYVKFTQAGAELLA